jgi:hypothetical protein
MMTGRELSRPFVEYSSDWVRANVRPPQPIGERMMLSARDLLKMWRDLVVESDGVPRYTVLPGAALNTLVGWTDDELTRPLTGGVTAEMVRLVVAARAIAFGGLFDGCGEQQMAAIRELDEASEAFAATVPWTDEP